MLDSHKLDSHNLGEKLDSHNLGRKLTPYALKGQKLLAQGNALGMLAFNKAPCKGKSFANCLVLESFCPYRAAGLRP